MKVVINKCFGGFSLSPLAMKRMAEMQGNADSVSLNKRPKNRSDPILVAVVEELGNAANGEYAKLSVVEIPDDVEYTIEEYDGMEHIAECHRTWG
ncbi:MAG: hypothetical protein BV459_05000 [Thermoplasmata archaeon M11B2D]|nr:MAG: hypothetical protein BV459_05000 [Thermoplasmata archaeon M11B2D]